MEKLDPKIDGRTVDIVAENIEKLKALFPEVFIEDKIDFDALKETLGDYIDGREERYSFTWNGKSKARWLAQTPSTGTLRPCPEESVNWDITQNLFIEGDNLEVLKLLQKSYYKKVKMIYIDPPYNTGNDFIYPDDFKDNIQNYLELTGQVDSEGKKLTTNAETSGRYHTDWLNMMYPRLKLARNLLREDGVIFISIGQSELANLVSLCDEIYGEENRISICGRLMKSGGNKGKFFSPNIEYFLAYARNIEEANGFRDEMSEDLIKKVYTQTENTGKRKGEKYRSMGLYQSSLDPLRGCTNQRYFVEAPDGTLLIPPGNVFPSEKVEGAKVKPVSEKDGVWRYKYETYVDEKSKGNIEFKETGNNVLVNENGNPSKWNVNTKIWLNDRKEAGQLPTDFISKCENRHSAKELNVLGIEFDFSKPSSFVKYLAKISGTTDFDIILDFFSGSSTTAHAVLDLNKEDNVNRKFLMVQLPEPCDEKSETYKAGYKTIAEIGKERIRRVIAKITAESTGKEVDLFSYSQESNLSSSSMIQKMDLGFKVFKLDSTSIKPWDVDFDNFERTLEDYISNVKDGRSEHDILYEILLKYGLDLTLPIEKRNIAGETVFVIGYGALVICLADNITLEVVEGIAQLKTELNPELMRVVFKDLGFKNDVVKTNAVQILRQAKIEDVKSL